MVTMIVVPVIVVVVRMAVRMVVMTVGMVFRDPGPGRLGARRADARLVHDKLRRRDTRPQDPLDANLVAGDREAPEGVRQLLERQARIEQRTEQHVAGNTRKTIEIQQSGHHDTGNGAFRALRSGRIVRLGATTDVHHGLLMADG